MCWEDAIWEAKERGRGHAPGGGGGRGSPSKAQSFPIFRTVSDLLKSAGASHKGIEVRTFQEKIRTGGAECHSVNVQWGEY